MAMSMNTMPLRNTWMPSGTWVAQTSRPAQSAGNRILSSISGTLFPHLIQARDGVVEQAEQVLRCRRATDRIRQFYEGFTGMVCKPSRRLWILVHAARDRVCTFTADAVDEFGQVSGAGRNARLRFDVHDLDHAEPVDQIHRVFVIWHEPHTFERRGGLLPSRDCVGPARLEVLAAARIRCRVRGIETRKPSSDDCGDLCDVVRVELNVRITAGMDVAFRAIET